MLGLIALGAVAQYPCVKVRPWTCFGSIEQTITSGEGNATIGMRIFENGDILYELNSKSSGAQKLLALGPPPILALYKGVSDKELREGHPFIFFDYGFATPLLALESSFADGPNSVSDQETERRVTLDPQIEATLVASRVSRDKIHFKISMPGHVLDGTVDFAKSTGFPDALDLSEWKDRDLRSYATVGEARAMRKQPKSSRPGER